MADILKDRSTPDEQLKPVTREYLDRDETLGTFDAQKHEAKLVRKFDCFIVPVMMLLMLILYIDRGNIRFAATQRMTDDVGLQVRQLNTAISVF
ncbi:hypothetical protein B0J11DRAFT_577773 [Dendryphion nanum]|uniref:MFS transporter n=1 Tax=Dendryphion nanum TaxID=256645 RepID=A0A9P9E3T9_9PLEO|nr:hypothetical protein B0J11DRAFT_577773 [Dendryphion nanum]